MDKITVVAEKLTDGSKVYAVHIYSDDDEKIILDCYDKQHADALRTALEGVCGVWVEEVEMV